MKVRKLLVMSQSTPAWPFHEQTIIELDFGEARWGRSWTMPVLGLPASYEVNGIGPIGDSNDRC